MDESTFSHVDERGAAHMVDVGHKPHQNRMAIAEGKILLQPETIQKIIDNNIKKGDVLRIAEFAGIMGAKQTSNLIPLCHQLLLTKIDVHASLESYGVRVQATARTVGQTGVEMEALTSVSVALLTLYDMCKAVDKTMQITDIVLLEKTKE